MKIFRRCLRIETTWLIINLEIKGFVLGFHELDRSEDEEEKEDVQRLTDIMVRERKLTWDFELLMVRC